MNKLYDREFRVEQPQPKQTHSAPKCTLRKCGVPTDSKNCPFYVPELPYITLTNGQDDLTSFDGTIKDEFKCPAGGIHDYRLIGHNYEPGRDFHVAVFCTKCLDITEKLNII